MRQLLSIATALFAMAAVNATPARAQDVTKQDVQGIKNFARLETTVACAGATNADAIPEIKKMGFVAVINLRESREPGANVPEEEASAKSVGLRYYHIPFNASKPDPAAAEQFLDAITTNGSEPAFIHCAGGGRAATMWFIKRLAVDHWDVDRASKEATELGMTSPTLKQFAIDFAKAHQR